MIFQRRDLVSNSIHEPTIQYLALNLQAEDWPQWLGPKRDGVWRESGIVEKLPVQSEQGGAGIESQFLTTLKHDEWRLHFNAGAFYDPRGDDTVRGWRGSVLAEFPRERWRPGVELFARRAHGGETRAQLGFGAIAQLERIEIRTGIHVGLSDAAPDVEGSLWLSWSWDRGNGDGR